MREIKFRAWDNENKRMIHSGDFIEYEEIEIVVGENTVYCLNTEPYASAKPFFIPMEYINKKDKNGKEMYDGDFITVENDFDCQEKALAVHWSDDLLTYCVFQCGHEEVCLSDLRDIEVVGNVFENPELDPYMKKLNKLLKEVKGLNERFKTS